MEPSNPFEAGLVHPDSYQIWQPDNTDNAFIFFIIYRNFLKKCIESIDKAGEFYTQSKEWYYTINAPVLDAPKQYSGKEIIQLKRLSGSLYNRMYDRLSKQDQFYLIIMKLKPFIEKVYKSIDDAHINYFQRKDFYFTFIPPLDFFDNNVTPAKNYSAKQIMIITSYAKKLNEMNIPFPEPIYWKVKQAIIDASEFYTF